MFSKWRAQYASQGYALIPDIISVSDADKIRLEVINGCIARKNTIIDLPLIDSVVKRSSRIADPLYDKLQRRLQKHKLRAKYIRAQRKLKKGKSTMGDVSGDDVWEISKKVADALVNKTTDSTKPGVEARIEESTIHNDSLMLSAITKHQANLWMTSSCMESRIRGEFGKKIGCIAREVVTKPLLPPLYESQETWLDNPFLFADLPVYRESVGRPLFPSFGAYEMGCNTLSMSHPCCVAWVFFDDHNDARMPIQIFENSHKEVREQYWANVNPRDLHVEFKPMESHIPQHLKMFNFTNSVRARSLHPTKGSVLICDPHMFVGSGCNYATTPSVIYRGYIMGEGCKPSMKAPSWISDWRSVAADVNFKSNGIFPHL